MLAILIIPTVVSHFNSVTFERGTRVVHLFDDLPVSPLADANTQSTAG